jgi:small conductance mechanosensitive channel
MEEILGIPMETIQNNILVWAKHVVFALLIFWIGMRVVKLMMRALNKALQLRQVDPSLTTFLQSLVKIGLQAMVIIATINQLGVATTSIVAVLASAGLAIGMALSGTLQNFAGGAMILMFKPFKVGDFIEAQGYSGTVQSIQIFVTVLTTPDNKQVVIPNGGLSNGSLINYSAQPTRRQEWTFGIDYGSDLDEAKQIIHDLLEKDERVHAEPAPLVELAALADSSVNIIVRAWVDTENFWSVYYDMNTDVYKIFTDRGISIPFPQLNVHLQK